MVASRDPGSKQTRTWQRRSFELASSPLSRM
jgi:hypothetical protein